LRLVLDTNVWVSAFLTPGGMCENLVRAHHPETFQFLVSRFLLKEIEKVLDGKIQMPAPMVEERLKYVIRRSLLVEPSRTLKAVNTCDADNRILECAVAGGAAYLVTGDKNHLLPLGRFEGVEIVTPRKMLELLKR
jgi:putative PIN family toxin of toxin-antitoxin system